MSGRRDMRRAAWASLVVAGTFAWVGEVAAEPTNPTIVGDSAGLGAGAATIDSLSNGPGTDLTVTQHAERVFIDWQSFNIGTSDTVHFDQGGSHWIAVNRVTGGLGPTTIEGMLTADGHVWIIDPAGIAFSSNAIVDVGGLLATASNIDPGDFLAVTDLEDAGGFTFSAGGNDTAQISNAGTINSSGLLALVAPIVDNSGTLDSAYGDVLLGGANAFRLSFTAVQRPADAEHPTAFDELLVTDFIIETPVTNDPTPGNETVPVTNTGNLSGANIIVSAASAGGGAFINMDGVVEATTIGDRSGDVVILGGGDFIGGAADASSGGTEAIRIENADISADGDFVVQGTGVSIEKGAGPGTLTAGAIRIAATNGDATSDTDLTTTAGGIDISASGLVSVTALDAATTVDLEAADIDLGGAISGGGAVTLEATTTDISGADIDIEGASVELTGAITATDSATITATVGDLTLNDDMTSTGSILLEAASGKITAAGLDAATTLGVGAEDIDLNGTVVGGGAVTMTASVGDISGTDIDIEGASVKLTGAVTATNSATITATAGDLTLNDGMTSTGSIVLEATSGKVTAAGLDAATTLGVSAEDIDLNGTVVGGGAVTMTASAGDISGADIDIEGASVELTGAVAATNSATITATAGDLTLNDDMTSTGSILLEATEGKVTTAGLDAGSTLNVTADDIEVTGNAKAGGLLSMIAELLNIDLQGTAEGSGVTLDAEGDVTAAGTITATSGGIDIDAGDKASLAALDASAAIDIDAADIDLNGTVAGDGTVTMTASVGDISGTDIDIEGASVELTGPVAATDSATITATTGDLILNDNMASTGSILLEASSGKVTAAGLDAATTLGVTAEDIDLNGTVVGGSAVTMTASVGDISGTDIDIEGASVELTGAVAATDSATITATTGDLTLNNDMTSTGSILLEATDGKVTTAGLDAGTTLDVTADDIEVTGNAKASGLVSMIAELLNIDLQGTVEGSGVALDAEGDVTVAGTITASSDGIDIDAGDEANLAALSAKSTIDVDAADIDLNGAVVGGGAVTMTASAGDISGTGIDIEGASVELTGAVAATDSASIVATTGDLTLNDELTSTGSVLLEAEEGKVTTAGLDAGTTLDVTADDIEVTGNAKAGGLLTMIAQLLDIDLQGTTEGSGLTLDAEGDVTATGTITATSGGIDIDAGDKASLAALDAHTTIDIDAADIDLSGMVAAGNAVTMTASAGDISGTDIDIEGASVVLTGPVNATDSANIVATTGDLTLNNDITSTGSILLEAASGKVTVAGLDADTTLDVTAEDIDLNGTVAGGGAVTMTASAGNISGTDIDIEGASVELSGPVDTTDSATITATAGDLTLNDDVTSTGSILLEASEGKVTAAGLDAGTTLDITADDIEVTGNAKAGGALRMIAEALDIVLQGTVEAASVYLEAAGDITASDTITATTGAIEIEAGDEAHLTALDAETTIEVTAASLEVTGDATAGGDATFRALTGDATLGGKTTSEGGDILIEAKLGQAMVNDAESDGDTTIVAGGIKVLGDIVAMGQALLQALTGDVDVQGSVTANGGLLLLEAGQGDAIINRISSLTNVSIMALDLDLSGSISAGDEVRLTSLDSGTTVVLGGDGGTGSVILRNPAGLTIDADELSRISTGKLRIDAEANDALLLDVDFSGATLGDLSIGASNSSQIIAAGSVQGLDALTLGYVDGADDRRPGLIVVPGELGKDTTTGRLGSVTLNSSQDIIIGPQAFQAFYQSDDPSLAALGKLNPATFGTSRNHIFIAADDLKLYAPGDIVQLNTGSGVDGRGIVFKVAAVDEGVVNPSGTGPEKVVLFGVIIRDDGKRVTSYSAGLEPRILFPGTKDANGNVIEEPLAQSKDYRFNLCIIGDAVSCSNALLREAEPTAGVAGSDPNPYVAGPDLSFDDEEDDLDGEGDLGGVAATGNESLWGAGVR